MLGMYTLYIIIGGRKYDMFSGVEASLPDGFAKRPISHCETARFGV